MSLIEDDVITINGRIRVRVALGHLMMHSEVTKLAATLEVPTYKIIDALNDPMIVGAFKEKLL